MGDLNTYISGLTKRAEKLVKNQTQLVADNKKLKQQNADLQNLVSEQKNTLTQLEEQNKVVKIAKAVTEDDGDRLEQRKRLNELVREVDKCIALLNN